MASNASRYPSWMGRKGCMTNISTGHNVMMAEVTAIHCFGVFTFGVWVLCGGAGASSWCFCLLSGTSTAVASLTQFAVFLSTVCTYIVKWGRRGDRFTLLPVHLQWDPMRSCCGQCEQSPRKLRSAQLLGPAEHEHSETHNRNTPYNRFCCVNYLGFPPDHSAGFGRCAR